MSDLFKVVFICLILVIAIPTRAEEPNSNRVGASVNYGYNFDGDMYETSQSLNFLYQYNLFQFNLGIKRYDGSYDEEYISDLSMLYSLYQGNKFDFKIGVGLENQNPTIEYVSEYTFNDYFGLNIILNQVLNNDFGQNQREVVAGLTYYFYEGGKDEELREVQPRPALVDKQVLNPCKTKLSKAECDSVGEAPSEHVVELNQVLASPNTKPQLELPYVVQEGDWLYQLRREYDFDLEEIIRNNNIEDPDLIFPGQILK
ncbi:LysM peptidoglycan-binding domain-containing protein [Vibrio chagasii]|nr:LysM peptidoglycan-binding domain-containing protein [Vibrio chagasii]CAH6811788.1 LysM peptidoglycan-binding domain-containing protein [Vibrio chagasii]CAH6844550.1 LysM peptidoglycan-binding domain-containing protein [Vibrio chagasii]CAH6982073.1 LysM peptidoglycan-binding domain-containing protein [Vibrio chagasii]CAH7025272.1 LysM peptidoglycan-binding domain-containing protein [Vibrio chagasii]